MLRTILYLYIAMFLSFIIHEIAHGGNIKILKYFPIPLMASMRARWRYTGLMANSLIFILIWYLKPESLFLQICGLFNFVYVCMYLFIGSFNKEPVRITKYTILDDVKNSHAFYAVTIAIIFIFLFGSHYLGLIQALIA